MSHVHVLCPGNRAGLFGLKAMAKQKGSSDAAKSGARCDCTAGGDGGRVLLARVGPFADRRPPPAQSQQAQASNTAPGAPTGLTLTRAGGELTASWTAASGATGYDVNISQDSKVSWTRHATGQAGTSATFDIDFTLVYHVAVRAVNTSGESGWVVSSASWPQDIVPDEPTGLTATRTAGQVTVSWTAPDNAGYVVGALGYDVNWSNDHKNSWTRHASGQSATSATITSGNSATWYVAVRAVTAGGWSDWVVSDPIEASFLILPAPDTVTITNRGLTGMTVGWSAVNNAQGYNVNASADGGNSWTRLAGGTTGTSLAVDSSISGFAFDSGATYIAAVQAVDQGVGGAWRNSAASGPVYPPGPPADVRGTRSGLTTINVTWSAPADDGGTAITGYDVNMSANGGQSWSREHSNVTGTSATVSGINNATSYIFAVRARNAAGEGNWANSATVPALAAPSVTAHRGASFIDVEWPAMTGTNGYQVDYSLDDGATWTTAYASVSVSTRTVRIGGTSQLSIPNADGHAVRVRAVNANGYGLWGEASVGFAFKPIAVTGVSTTRTTSGELDVTWNTCNVADDWCNGGSPVTGYAVNLSSDGGWSWTRAKDVAVADFASGGTVTLTGVSDATAYLVSVSMQNRVGGSWKNATVPAATTTQLRTPTNLTVINQGAVIGTTITRVLHWEKPTAASQTDAFTYEIECNSSSTTDWSSTTCPDDITTAVSDQHNQSSVTYDFATNSIAQIRVRAAKDGADSLWMHVFPTPSTPTGYGAQVHDGALKVWWNRGAGQTGATGYDVQCSSVSPQVWSDCHSEPASLTAGFYVSPTVGQGQTVTTVRIRARQGQRVGDWTAVTSVPSGTLPSKAGNVAVSSVSSNGTTVTYAISWDKPSNTSTRPVSYAIECSRDGGTTWERCGTVAATATATGITGTATHTTARDRFTHVRVRGDEGYLRGAWSDAVTTASLTVSNLTSTGATLTIGNNLDAAWYYKASAGPDTSCSSVVSAGTTTKALTGLTPGSSYTYTAYEDSACTGTAIATTGSFTAPITFTATNILAATATLNLPGYPSAWSHKRTAGPASTTCTSVNAGTTTSNLSSLTANTLYGYTAYSDSSCTTANKLKSVHFSTTTFSVSNLDEEASAATGCSIGYLGSNMRCAVAFTTGTEPGGYRLKSVNGAFVAKTGSPGTITVAVHAADTTNSSNPASTSLVTLSGADPDTAGTHTYTCSGSACDLSASTTYFVVLSTADSSGAHKLYTLRGTTSDDEANYPATGSFRIANVGRSKSGSNAWADLSSSGSPMIHIAANGIPALAVSNIRETTATLNLSHHVETGGTWYYKSTAQGSTCSAQQSASTADLTGLSPGTSYTYSAYSDSSCATLIDAAPAFTTGGQSVSISTVTATSDGYAIVRGTILASGPFTTGVNAGGYTLNSVVLNMDAAVGTPGTLAVTLRTTSSDNPSTTQATLALESGSDPLTAGQATYTCSSGCALDANTKYHIVLAASSGSTNNEYRWRSAGSPTATLTPQGNGWSYSPGLNYFGSWQSIGGNALMQVSATANIGLTASSLTQQSARLTLSQHGGKAWWYQGNQTNAPCTAVAAGTTTADLSSLTAGTSYTYKAYGASTCASAAELASVTFTTGASGDYDADNDGLIEVSSLAQLNALRWDLDGDGTASSGNTTTYAAAFPSALSNMGCHNSTCSGYEMVADLDFDTNGNNTADSGDTYWNNGAGWTPIGDFTTSFTGTLDGNGYKLSNLFINISTTADGSAVEVGGFFGVVGKDGEVRNLGLEDVDITVTSTQEDQIHVGAAAGDNRGTLTGVWSSGTVDGSTGKNSAASWVFVGGLVGRSDKGGSGNTAYEGVIRASYSSADVTAKGSVTDPVTNVGTDAAAGGITGRNKGTIAASFATGDITADSRSQTQKLFKGSVGGLVGINSGPVTASYATGALVVNVFAPTASNWAGGAISGGLVGDNKSGGNITASYSTGAITHTGDTGPELGGLLGKNAAIVTNSYWDTTTSSRSGSAGGTGQTTSALQTPTGYTGIYANWNVNVDGVTGNDNPWHFGTSSQYPVLDYGILTPSSQRP